MISELDTTPCILLRRWSCGLIRHNKTKGNLSVDGRGMWFSRSFMHGPPLVVD